MPRYKGRSNPKAIERAFPHIVEMAVPPTGFGKRLDAMHEWHHARGIQSRRGSGRYAEPTSYIRWCFADAPTAAQFQAASGGEVLMPTDPVALIEWGKRNIQN